MAQMVEVLSVSAAGRALKEPRVIPRPSDGKAAAKPAEAKKAAAVSHGGLLTAAAMRGKVVAAAPAAVPS